MFDVLYWHWLLLGMMLIISEIFMPSFTILWFGLGALVVGALLRVFELPLPAQILIWTLASVGFTVLWFKYFKPKMIDKTSAGISRDAAIGAVGQVIKAPSANDNRGQVRFVTPVIGADEWEFICSNEIMLGDRVRIKEIHGNSLIVEKSN